MEQQSWANGRGVRDANAHAATTQGKAKGPLLVQGRDPLDSYLGELAAYSLLDAEQELALAREIEELELVYWKVLLSAAPAVGVVTSVLAELGQVPEAWAELTKRGRVRELSPAKIDALAQQLRENEAVRSIIPSIDARVRAACAELPNGRVLVASLERARRAHAAAKERMITANLRLVVALARRYARSLLPMADLIQEGNLGLLRAVERFDYRRGLRFSTYAVWWIRHAFNRALSDRGRLVRVPVHALEDAHRIAKAQHTLFARTGVEPGAEELAAETGIAVERIAPFTDQGVGRSPLSLDRKVGEEGDATLADLIAADGEDPTTLLDAAAWQGRVEPLLDQLSEMEAAILRYRFGFADGEELTLREVGEKYSLSRERIRQLQEQALGKLRRALTEQGRFGESAA